MLLLGFGGSPAPVGVTSTELYNGTSWTSNPTGLNTARQALAGAGIQTSALAFGGFSTSNSAASNLGLVQVGHQHQV
jgi:hypothetical protein